MLGPDNVGTSKLFSIKGYKCGEVDYHIQHVHKEMYRSHAL